MKKRSRLLAVALVLGGASELAAQDSTILRRFLFCIECTFEVDSLASLGVRQPTATRDSLIFALRQGPSNVRRINMQAKLDSTYTRLQAGLVGPLPIARPAYVAHYLSNFIAGYQKRAAMGLALVGRGDTLARVALDSAWADTTLRVDVRNLARFARDSIWHP